MGSGHDLRLATQEHVQPLAHLLGTHPSFDRPSFVHQSFACSSFGHPSVAHTSVTHTFLGHWTKQATGPDRPDQQGPWKTFNAEDGKRPGENGSSGGMGMVREGPGGPAGGSRPKILVVDDEAAVRAGVEGILVEAGYRVACRGSVQEAKEALDRESFDLVLTDLYLEDQTLGFEIAEVARRCQPPVPAILLTGRPSLDGAQEAIRSQVCELVVKPVDPVSLITSCRRAIHNARLEQHQRRLEAQNQVLARVLPRAIEAKDPTTCGHAERVVRYTDVLAQRCGVSKGDRQDLRMASLLHDVGKIGIPENILTKPDRLTTDEREVIKRHPELGFEILEPLVEGEQIRRWVVQHHERWDGCGYPAGLVGEEVDLPGRILILAEVYDALAEARSYKPAWPTDKIVGFFRAEAGKHFDPCLAALVADGLERLGNGFFRAEPGTPRPSERRPSRGA